MIHPLQQPKELGVGVAFDDYGTGYAFLSLLKRCPPIQLKIDRLFVNNSFSDTKHAAAVEAIITLAEAFGLDVVAEGIENEEQETALKKLGCERGSLYARPMPVMQLLTMLSDQVATHSHKKPITINAQMVEEFR